MNETQEQKDETLSVCSAPDAQESQKEQMDIIDGEEDNDDNFTLSTLDEESDEGMQCDVFCGHKVLESRFAQVFFVFFVANSNRLFEMEIKQIFTQQFNDFFTNPLDEDEEDEHEDEPLL